MKGIILYDGYCNLCSGVMRFISKRDRKRKYFSFVPLQSKKGKELLRLAGLPESLPDAVIYHPEDKFYRRSSAMLHILKDMGRGWQFFYGIIILPPFIRDNLFRLVSQNRYRLFGKSETCEYIN